MTTATTDYAVDLEVFQGPLDLLLYLIRKDEIDIYDIPIARITAQYLRYVELLKLLNLENAGEYILMAATLIRIKAQMLLPRDSSDQEELDPREELTRALLEYRKYKEAGEILEEKREFESRLIGVFLSSNGHRNDPAILSESTSLFDLLTAFHGVMAAFREESQYFVAHESVTVEDRVKVIAARLSQLEYATFEDLFADIKVKLIAIVTFMAVLEMMRTRRITVRQSRLFSELRVYPTGWLQVPYGQPLPEDDVADPMPQEMIET